MVACCAFTNAYVALGLSGSAPRTTWIVVATFGGLEGSKAGRLGNVSGFCGFEWELFVDFVVFFGDL